MPFFRQSHKKLYHRIRLYRPFRFRVYDFMSESFRGVYRRQSPHRHTDNTIIIYIAIYTVIHQICIEFYRHDFRLIFDIGFFNIQFAKWRFFCSFFNFIIYPIILKNGRFYRKMAIFYP